MRMCHVGPPRGDTSGGAGGPRPVHIGVGGCAHRHWASVKGLRGLGNGLSLQGNGREG